MIVVTLTSWTKRIGSVKKVVESIMSNTLPPDRLYLNLSSEEFKGIELPMDLTDYFKSDYRLIINWVDGPNTKSMKKIFPILKYLNDDDIIIDADDDILFPKDLIESRVDDFEKNGRKYCISSNPHNSVGFNGKMKVISATSLFQKKMLKHWDIILTENVLKTYNDDRTYLTLLWLNGYINIGPSKWSVQELLEKFDMKLDEGMKEKKTYLCGSAYDRVVAGEFKKSTRKDILASFAYFRNKNEYCCYRT